MRAAIASFMIMAAGAAHTAPCDQNGTEAIPSFERAKSAFLAADYDRVIRVMDLLTEEQKAVTLVQINQVRAALPTEYTSCQVLIQRRDVAFVQEVTAFYTPEIPVPMFFYLQAIPVDGEMKISQFHFDGRIAEVMTRVK